MIIGAKWGDFQKYLAKYMTFLASPCSQDGSDSMSSSIHVTYEAFYNGNVLHVMCQHHPPAKLVKQVASMFPLLTVQVNRHKQTPLHVAAQCGASHRAMDALVKCGQSACLMKDINGRTPLLLHLRECSGEKKCDISTGGTTDECVNQGAPKKLQIGPSVKVLRVLAEGAPDQMHMADSAGESPLNYPIRQGHQQQHSANHSFSLKKGVVMTAIRSSRRYSIVETGAL
jgi:hypothetical protein